MNNALFVCFGGMSNVGTLTGLAGRAVAQGGDGTIFCLDREAVRSSLLGGTDAYLML